MEIPSDSERKYPELNLHELNRLLTSYLRWYPFVRAVYLYPGIRQPYTLLFEVLSVPKKMARDHRRFLADIDSLNFCLPELHQVYRDKKPISQDDRPMNEWKGWEVANGRNIEAEGLRDFVQDKEPVCLYVHRAVKNDPDLFSELCFATLKSYADEWAKRWPVIKTIKLFRDRSLAPQNPQIGNVPVKYALVFEIAGKKSDLVAFEDATNCNHTIRDENGNGVLYGEFMTPVFTNVYRWGATKNYQEEWEFFPKRPFQKPCHFESNPSWLLYNPGVEFNAVPSISAAGQILATETLKKELVSAVQGAVLQHQLIPVEKDVPPNQDLSAETKQNIRMSEFDRGLLAFAKRKQKKNPSLSIPGIAKLALREEEDFLSLGRRRSGKKPKQETIEKRLRKLLKHQE